MRQSIMDGPGQIRFLEVPVVPPAPDEVQIRVRQIGICGSDIHVWHGQHPFTPFPVVQGHEFMGVVAAVGSAVANPPAIGAKVTALPQIVCGSCNPCKKGRFNICENLKVRGFQAEGCGRDYYNVPADRLVPLPETFSADQGAFVEPVSVAVHACSRAGDLNGRNVVVLGAGTIGNLIAQVAKARGAGSVLITDVAPHRLDVARQCGVDHTVDVRHTSLADAARKAFGPGGFDLAFEAAGAEASLGSAVAAIEKGGTILIVGVYGKPPVVDMAVVGEHEVVLAGSMMYWKEDWVEAVRLLDGLIDIRPLVSRHFDFAAWSDAYRYIDTNGADIMKVMVDVG
ncbi:MAG: alcohol dehydrogenase catalytic domain-containing protein [Ancalomicrobiaceae bacterium]|nr:alcohol dehydrogenase catalytic domain-containing protein [Ancalomicrobiaceae bacterium]